MIEKRYGMLVVTGAPLWYILRLTLAKLKEKNRPGLTDSEIMWVAMTVGAFWRYDYEAAKAGIFGKHALLKSGFHSDTFLDAGIILKHRNLREIMAQVLVNGSEQMLAMAKRFSVLKPDFVAGVPRGATLLAKEIAKIIGAKPLVLEKVNGRIVLKDKIPASSNILFVEDALSQGTGIKEASSAIKSEQPKVRFLPYLLAFLNRTSASEIKLEGLGPFQIISCLESPLNIPCSPDIPLRDSPPVKIRSWSAGSCPLCDLGSEPIKPKDPKTNWEILVNSQKA